MHARTCAHTHARTHACVQVHTHIHTHIHTYIHTHMPHLKNLFFDYHDSVACGWTYNFYVHIWDSETRLFRNRKNDILYQRTTCSISLLLICRLTRLYFSFTCSTPEQCPVVVSLLSESYNPHVRCGAALALGIACAGTGNRVSIIL